MVCDRRVEIIGGRVVADWLSVGFFANGASTNGAKLSSTVAIGAAEVLAIEGCTFTEGSIVNCCVFETGAIALGPVFRIDGAFTRSLGVSDLGFSKGLFDGDGGAT